MRALSLALLIGCSSPGRPVMLPSGTRGWHVKCGSEAACFTRAEKVCPRGYRVVQSREYAQASRRLSFGGGTVREGYGGGSMVIVCNGPDPGE